MESSVCRVFHNHDFEQAGSPVQLDAGTRGASIPEGLGSCRHIRWDMRLMTGRTGVCAGRGQLQSESGTGDAISCPSHWTLSGVYELPFGANRKWKPEYQSNWRAHSWVLN